MKKRLFLITFFVILITVFLVFFQKDSEKIISKSDSNQTSTKDYKVYLNDDCIYFYDEKGNAVIYNFSGDKISEAFMLISVSSLEEAESVKEFYFETLASGDVEEIIADEDLVTIVYNDAYLENFKNYTKQDIEAMLRSGD